MKNNLRVWYGFAKLTKKAVKKRQLVIFFENQYSYKNDAWIEQKIQVVHIRNQTKDEIKDCHLVSRTFTKYGYFIDDKPFLGNIERVLEKNFLADSKNVSEKERQKIRDKLREAYYRVYNIEKKQTGQQAIIFN